MIRVTIRVEGQTNSSVTVLAENIRAAVRIVQARYPGVEARIAYPIDPESFFAGDPLAAVRLDDLEAWEETDPLAGGSRLSVSEGSRA